MAATASGTVRHSAPGGGLEIRGLRAGYGKIAVLDGISLQVPARQVTALVGPNGAGKSTLLRAISGLVRVREGEIALDGRSLLGRPAHRIAAAGVIQVPESREIFGGMTVWENLKVAFDNLDPEGDEASAFDRVYRLFPLLRERRDQLAGNLSGGQQQMLAIARALLGRPKILMLDEPSLGLAAIIIKDIFAALAALRDEGMTILLVEQNARMAIRFADRAYVLVNGRVVLSGERDEMLASDELVKNYLGGG